MLGKLPKGKKMTDATLAQSMIKQAFPVNKHGNAKGARDAAYRKLKQFTRRRIRAIWDKEARRIEAHEMRAIEDAALAQARAEYVGARNRIEALTQRANERHARFHSAGSGSLE